MVDGFEHLKRLGAQKVHETTHISKHNIELILDKSFSELKKIQFMGFISILEREYSIDLSELKAEYEAWHINKHENTAAQPKLSVDSSGKKTVDKRLVGVLAAAAAVLIFFALKDGSQPEAALPSDLNSDIVEEARMMMEQEENLSLVTEETATAEDVEPVLAIAQRLTIAPKMNLWIGMIDLSTFKRSQKLTDQPFDLDPEKEWLMILGHGQVKVEMGEKEFDLADKRRVRLYYKAGSVRQVSQEEFLVMNRGSDW